MFNHIINIFWFFFLQKKMIQAYAYAFFFKLPLFLKIFSFFNSSQINQFSLFYFFFLEQSFLEISLEIFSQVSRTKCLFKPVFSFAYHSVCVGIFVMILKLSILVASYVLWCQIMPTWFPIHSIRLHKSVCFKVQGFLDYLKRMAKFC